MAAGGVPGGSQSPIAPDSCLTNPPPARYAPRVNLATIGRYLCGDARAIHSVATSSVAIPVGAVLVLLTGIARNYDQSYWRESPFWLIGPLLFSFFSGSFLFVAVYQTYVRRHLPPGPLPPTARQYHSFMGLFWMTAPIAWLYAIPVERFFDSYAAAQANLTLLAIVSLWRVLLMARVVSVLNGAHFLWSLGWVLVGAALEVVMVVFCGGPASSKGLLAAMGGMRNAPEEDLMLRALSTAWMGAWLVLAVVLIALAVKRCTEYTRPFPELTKDKFPWLMLAGLALAWTLIALGPQREQQRFTAHAKLVGAGSYSNALAYLAQHQPGDFPKGRRLEPNPYEYRVWEQLPPTIALLSTNTPPWIRELYRGHLSATLKHGSLNFRDAADVSRMVTALEQIPEGREWVRTNSFQGR
jgi:hypothetical protein